MGGEPESELSLRWHLWACKVDLPEEVVGRMVAEAEMRNKRVGTREVGVFDRTIFNQ